MDDSKVPCALIFFNRPEPLAKSFAAIREYQPTKLFLIQDGAREEKMETDTKLINQCREVVSKIDWNCEVIKIFSDKNLGCGYRIYSGVKKAFEYVDRLAIIEDDIVCSSSFFLFVEDLLERYKNDEHIQMISGMNQMGIYERTPYDYIFTSWGGSIWGWATWKRVWDTFEYGLSWMDNAYEKETIFSSCFSSKISSKLSKQAAELKIKLDKKCSLSAWSGLFGFSAFLYTRFIIVPKYNLTSNIGLTADSTHATDNIKLLPKKTRRLFNMKTYVLKFPLKHPKYIIDDYIFSKQQERYLTSTNWIEKIEPYYRIIRYGGIKYIYNKIRKKSKNF